MTLVKIHAPLATCLIEDMFQDLAGTVAQVLSCSILKALLIVDKCCDYYAGDPGISLAYQK